MGTNDTRAQVPSIQTLVFLDFEATGLFPEDPLNPLNDPLKPGDANRDTNRLLTNYIRTTNPRDAPRITEICALSVSRKQIEGATDPANMSREEVESLLGLQPAHTVIRLPCNVHVRQINPHLSDTEWTEYELRRTRTKAIKYSRSQLEEKNSFAVEWQGVKLFLEQLPKPICILAHNGVKFDFRVLHAELVKAELLQSNPIPSETYFVDTLIMFMDLEKKLHDELRTLTQTVDWGRVGNAVRRPIRFESNGVLAPVAEVSDENKRNYVDNINEQSTSADSCEAPLAVREEIRLQQYETPRKRPAEHRAYSEPTRTPRRRLRFDMSDDHPLQFARMSQWSPAKKIRLRPNFFQRTTDGDWQFDNHMAMRYFTEKGVFRLEDMYSQLTKRKFDAHFAQDDCDALLQVCLAYGRDFLHYVDNNFARFPY